VKTRPDRAPVAGKPARRGQRASLRKEAPGRPFDRVLVANRGEIALRVIRACRDLGMEVVAVYSDADADAAQVRAADYAVRIGPAPPGESYLRGETIVEAALESGAQAIHPGYGFLAERASFARLVETAGLVFVGPTAAAIAALGDKLAARRAAAAAGVPVVAGTLQPAATGRPDKLPALVAEAEAIGFPLLVKASAGGGGRGMRRVERVADLLGALVAAAAEASSTFGDGTVYLEREIRPARHVEVQLLGAVDGRVVAIGERDCSIQRRHQKLLEECPAPGLTVDERRYVHDLAVRAARSVGLTNAATAEFLYEGDGRFSFLEVNARLQVEHGITELVTGLDLVVEQFRLAAGWPLSPEASAAADASATPAGHALEVRLSAEDPAREFVPAPGRVGRWKMPAGPGIRVDTATQAGDRVPPDYDPLIAKIMANGRDRNEAIARLRRALDEVEVTGIQTTLPFHRAVLADPAFRAARLSTDWVGERWDGPADRRQRLDLAQLAAGLSVMDGAPREARDGQEVLPLQPGLDGHAPGWRRAGREAMLERWPR
jgi:acetyl/propionyl-CoA carboxylase alpha subunit